MSFAQLHDEARDWAAARNIARSLSHWQVMDMNLVHRQGFMRVSRVDPVGETGRLILYGVLRRETRANEYVLTKGPRFDAVVKASQDIAEQQLRAAEALA